VDVSFENIYPDTNETSEQSNELTEVTDQLDESSNNPLNPTEDPLTPTEEPLTPTEEPLTPTEEPLNPTEEPLNPTEEPLNLTEESITQTPIIESMPENITITIEEHIPVISKPPFIFKPIIIPKVVFIIPYRNRAQQLELFQKHISESLNQPSYRILIIHQKDARAFNRGAIKNIGFLVVKQLYPNHYKNITLVFNDIDSIPKIQYQYQTKHNIVKHFYGFKHTLGGIVCITGNDFEKINGFPNYWGWGYEDNMLQKRALKRHFNIDRSIFEPFMSSKIRHTDISFEREVNRNDFIRYLNNVNEGILSITGLKYEINGHFVDVTDFHTDNAYNSATQELYDIRQGQIPFKDMIPHPRKSAMKMNFL
jgi:hypothetical protein